ncbi:MAG TPA: RluA family pseudouridine synthase [Candidatus Aquilonibacter sp.]|nr:RluA family pseudouridine synthase [Candidatus Aquilonibacter sp.]
MPSKNMLPKGKRRHSVRAEYRKLRTELNEARAREQQDAEAVQAGERHEELYDTGEFMRDALPDPSNPYLRVANTAGTRNEMQTPTERRYDGLKPSEPEQPQIHIVEDLEPEDGVRSFIAEAAAAKMRLDAYLAKALPQISRGRVQLLIENGQVNVNGSPAKAKQKLRGGEQIDIEGEPQPAPLRAEPEDIPLDIVYEDEDLAVINKPAGMSVHAGAGSLEDNRGTLVNALLYHFGQELSRIGDQTGGQLRPGIVHRLDKQTSGLIIVAKDDVAHRKLAESFASRDLRKVYIALVHGNVKGEEGTIDLPIGRDLVRRTRMTTRRAEGRPAVSHWRVLERMDAAHGKFTLLEVRIETGRTHQIRVHLRSLGHPVVGDTLYGAPHHITPIARSSEVDTISLNRNFLHAAELDFTHPTTGKRLSFVAPLPAELTALLERLRG